jgi:O-antigen/teichoic acid export membrane protein
VETDLAFSAAVAMPLSPSANAVSAPPELGDEAARPRHGVARRLAQAMASPLASKGTWSVFDQGVVSGTSFFTAVIIGRLCSKEDLGVYYFALSIVLFVRGVQDHVISTPYMIYCNRRRGASLASYTGSTLVHELILAGLGMLGVLVLAAALSLGVGPAEVTPAIWILLATMPFLLLRECIRQLAFAQLHVITALVLDVVVCVLQLGGLAVLGLLGMLSVVAAYAVMGGACLVACLVWFVLRNQPLQLVRAEIAPDWKRNWTLARWALASMLAASITPPLTPWFLTAWHGTAANGVLAACMTLVGVSQMFLMGVGNFLSPRTARAFATDGLSELRRILREASILFGVTIGGFCLVFLAAGDWLLDLVFPGKYAGEGAVIAVCAFTVLANALGSVAAKGLWAIERPQANVRADLWTLVVTAVATLGLVPPWGPLGAATAMLGAAIVGAVIRSCTLVRLMSALSTVEPFVRQAAVQE